MKATLNSKSLAKTKRIWQIISAFSPWLEWKFPESEYKANGDKSPLKNSFPPVIWFLYSMSCVPDKAGLDGSDRLLVVLYDNMHSKTLIIDTRYSPRIILTSQTPSLNLKAPARERTLWLVNITTTGIKCSGLEARLNTTVLLIS